MVAIKIKNNLHEFQRNSLNRGALGAIKKTEKPLNFCLSATDKTAKPMFFGAKTEKPT